MVTLNSPVVWGVTPCSLVLLFLASSTCRLLLAWLILRPSKWRQCVPPKHQLTSTRLHKATSQKIVSSFFSRMEEPLCAFCFNMCTRVAVQWMWTKRFPLDGVAICSTRGVAVTDTTVYTQQRARAECLLF
jgi:hypothetical protein